MKNSEVSKRQSLVADCCLVLAFGAASLSFAYVNINGDFGFTYLAGSVFAGASAIWLSAERLRNTFVALAAMLVSFALAEFALQALDRDTGADSPGNYTRGYSQPLRFNGGPLGYGAHPNITVRAWKTLGSERIYEVTYTIDEEGRRATPGSREQADARGAFLFMGGSFAFGEGLNDDETLAYHFAKGLHFDYSVLNLGFSGYGAHQMLRMFELDKTGCRTGRLVQAVIYVGIPHHAYRAAGHAWWDPVGPKYELDALGAPRYAGRFRELPAGLNQAYYRWLQFFQVAQRSRLVERTVGLFQDVGSTELPDLARLHAAIVEAAASRTRTECGAAFHVLFWDDQSELSELILEEFSRRSIATTKVSDFIPHDARQAFQIGLDRHPNSEANHLLAHALLNRMGSTNP